jgi:bacterioferritin-associated ferredoxin
MYVCICNAITESDVLEAVEAGAEDLWDLQSATGLASGCGSCKEVAADMLREGRSRRRQFEPQAYVPPVA